MARKQQNKRLTEEQKDKLALKLLDLGHLVFAGTVVAQFFPGPLSHPNVALFGLAFTSTCYWITLRIMMGGDKT